MTQHEQHPAVDLSVTIAGIHLKNPVMAASGTCGYGEELSAFLDINALGAIVTKGISLSPAAGNPPPRIVETPSGMLNAIGLQNVGVEEFVAHKLPFLRQSQTPVIVNCFGKSVSEYCALCQKLSAVEGIAGLEINISCPNVKEGGMCFGTDPSRAHQLIREVRKATALPIIVKLSPNVTDIALIARSVEEAGADAVSLTNTFTGMVIDVDTCQPVLANITGGLSGPAIRPLSLRMVWETVQAVSVPVIGMGGIMDGTDALQYLIAGARAVQVGTALFVRPDAPLHIVEDIAAYLEKHGFRSVRDITGCLKFPGEQGQ
jgi:dihydroorotate dehydrogenase (NAD+) catalytic subunit